MNLLEDIFLAILIIGIGGILTWAFLWWNALGTEPPEIKYAEGNIIQNNSLIAISPLPFTPPVVLSSLVEAVIQCESGGDNTKVGKAGEIGLCQFKKQTWDWMCGLADFKGDIYNEEDQKWLIKWAFENGLEKHWTCFKKLTN